MISRPSRLSVASWILYDLANTIFSMNIISLYFALWVTVDKGGRDILYSVVLSGSMLVVAISMPVFGAISDITGKRRGPLSLLTFICCCAVALIELTDELFVGLFLFFIANYCYQSSMVFYNGMLPDVARGRNIGLVSGLGVGAGYLGSIVGLITVKPFVAERGRTAAFIPTALMFLVFALPCFIMNRDPIRKNPEPTNWRQAFGMLKKTFREVKKYRYLAKFICVHFLVLDVVNTVISFMSVYAHKVIGFDDTEINSFMIFATLAAMFGSLGLGWLVKTKGSHWTYSFVLMIWVITLSITALSQNEAMFWLVGPLAGVGMGGVWVVSRTFLIELCPPDKIGEFFGLYGMAGKIASIIGPLLWGSTTLIFENTETFKYRAAIILLLLFALVATGVYRSLLLDLQKTTRSFDKSVDKPSLPH